MPIEDIKESFSLLSKHQVVPIVLWNKSEYENLPNFGILTVNDPESGEESTMLLRKNMKKRIQENFNERKKLLEKTFIGLNSPAFFVGEKFNPLQMTEYFNEYFHA
jgi:predicted transposase YdaD